MNNAGSKKILILYIYEILNRYSDGEHKLTQTQIANLIKKNYGMECDRKAVGRNINLLIDAGYDISTYEENDEGYYLRDKLFTDAEVRMLIDSVAASRYISCCYVRDMVKRLQKLATVYLSNRILHITQVDRWIHTDNPYVFLNVEDLDKAINEQKKVRFTYNNYGLDMKLQPRHDYKYEVDPYQIICSNGRYYLACNYEKHNGITNFRIDLITDVEILDVKSTPAESLAKNKNSFDIAEYTKHAVNMYDGKNVSAVIRLKKERLVDVIDWFGKDISILDEEEDGFVRVKVSGSDEGIRMWAIQYLRIVEVLSPAYLRENIKQDIKNAMVKYEG